MAKNMKNSFFIILLIMCSCAGNVTAQTANTDNNGNLSGKATAQQNDKNNLHGSDVLPYDSLASLPINTECSTTLAGSSLQPYTRRSYIGYAENEQDSLHLPPLNMRGQVPLMNYPYNTWWGFDTWQLHKGLNVNLGASVFASFGKGAPKGAGFGQDISLMYATPINDKLSLAIGGWLSNAYWAHDRYTDAGINAVLGYKFNEHWEAYIYGKKSIMNKPVPYHFRSMQELGDRIGAAVRYNFSPSFSVQVTVEAGKSKLPDNSLFNGNSTEHSNW